MKARSFNWSAAALATALLLIGQSADVLAQSDQSAEAPGAATDATPAEIAFWNSVAGSTDPTEIEAYLKAHPNGHFAPLARIRLDKLKGSTAKAAPEKAPETTEADAPQESRNPIVLAARAERYEKGLGVPKDEAKAAQLYRKAAELDHADAMLSLGSMYEDGRGVPPDEAEAALWYLAALEHGNQQALNYLGNMYQSGRGVFKDEAKAVSFFRKAIGRYPYNTWAMFKLGEAYEKGRGVTKNSAQALTWYRKAADLGHAAAMFKLGWMYTSASDVKRNYNEALKWSRKAARLGIAEAMHNLAWHYENGKGVAKDRSVAAEWMLKSLKAHNDFALKEMTTNADAWSSAFRRALQQHMKQAGVYDGPIDGDFGPSTQAAMQALVRK